MALTPEQQFVKTIYTKCGRYVKHRRDWSRMDERVVVEPQRIQIVDTHPDQPGAVLLDVSEAEGMMTFRTCMYPFLDGAALRAVLPGAIRKLRAKR